MAQDVGSPGARQAPAGGPGHRAAAIALAAIVALAAAARFYHLGQQSLWTDEGFSYGASRLAWGDLVLGLPHYDSHPPLYYALLKLWSVFGDSEAALRSLSAVLSTAVVPAAYVLGRETLGRDAAGRGAGLLAALYMALQPMQIEYAQEARMYAGLTLGMAVMLAATAWLLRRPEAAGAPRLGAGTAARWAWLAVVGGAAFALWHQHMAIFAVLAVGAGALPWVLRHRRRGRLAANVLAAAAAIGVLWLPVLPMLLEQTADVSDGFWIPPADAARVVRALAEVYGPGKPPSAAVAAVGLIVVAAGLAGMARAGRGAVARLLAAAIVLPPLLQLAAEPAVGPIFLGRPLLWLAVPFAAALGAAVAQLPGTYTRLAVAAVIAALLVQGAWRQHGQEKEPWRGAAAAIEAQAGPHDTIVTTSAFGPVTLCYYWRERAEPRPVLAPPDAPRMFVLRGCRLVDDERARTDEGYGAALAGLAAGPGTIWLVDRIDPISYSAAAAAGLAARGAGEPVFEGIQIAVRRYP